MKGLKRKILILVTAILIIITIGFIIIGINFGIINFNRNQVINEEKIKDIAVLYTNKKETKWVSSYEADVGEVEYACVSIEKLIEDKYIDEDKLYDLNITNYLMVTRDMNKKIISSEYLYDDNICKEVTQIDVPLEEEVCNNLIYDGNSHGLVNTNLAHKGYDYINSNQIDAGKYAIKLSLQEYYLWSDNDTNDKEVFCSIEKASPTLLLSSYGNDSTKVGSVVTTLKSNVSGTVYIESSNANNVIVNENTFEIVADEDKDININTIAPSNEATYVTITVVPDNNYNKNYYSDSVVYTVGISEKKNVDIPTSEEYCKKNLVYNQNLQSLTKKAPTGVRFFNNKGINASDYKITAVLDYGYIWNDNTIDNKEFYCTINKEVPQTEVSIEEDTVIKEQENHFRLRSDVKGMFEIVSLDKLEFINMESYISDSSTLHHLFFKGTEVGDNGLIKLKFIPEDQTNYEIVEEEYKLNILDNSVNLKYDLNGGSGCSSNNKKIYYNEIYGDLCVPSKDGYEFIGWYDDKNSRTNIINSDTLVESMEDVTIYAHYKKNITLNLVQYKGENIITEQVIGEMYNDEEGVKIMLPTVSTHSDNLCSDWTRIGWTTEAEIFDESVEYKDGTEYLFSKNLTLYAKYEKKVSFIYDTNGGQKKSPKMKYLYKNASGKVSDEGKYIEYVSGVPSRKNCKFIGWYNGSELIASADILKNGASVVVNYGCNGYKLVAKWDDACK